MTTFYYASSTLMIFSRDGPHFTSHVFWPSIAQPVPTKMVSRHCVSQLCWTLFLNNSFVQGLTSSVSDIIAANDTKFAEDDINVDRRQSSENTSFLRHKHAETAKITRVWPRQARISSSLRNDGFGSASIRAPGFPLGAISTAVVVLFVPASTPGAVAMATSISRIATQATPTTAPPISPTSKPILSSSLFPTSTTLAMGTARNVSTTTSIEADTPAPSNTAGTEPAFAPPLPPDEGPLSPFAQLGVGFVVTFGILAIAAAIAISIWRRRRKQGNAANAPHSKRHKIGRPLTRILGRRKNDATQFDAERNISLIEEASITRATRFESVSTVSRVDSRSSDSSIHGNGHPPMQSRKLRMALTSNTVTANFTASSSRLSEAPAGFHNNSRKETEEVKFQTWPLKE
ncbi:hypothetical protein EK21DRAFT_88863 [Setomelanomma holmii]|uniref:Uncharacterized protein n=1 Tax=Setomelanomma holmii TaxID=210430 RepID=A0A9P4LM46_9PLEO|nr:hypothetical protein EK21DRAFT_88863 [Setomelanomma holmii]